MSLLHLSDVDLYYETHGSGPPLVLIHGAGGSHLSWWRQVSLFQQSRHVIVYDQRGFGASRAKADYDPGDALALTRDLEALLDGLGVREKVVVVGHSLGSLPALDFAEANPNRVAGLVLSSAYGGLSTPALEPFIHARAALFSAEPPAPIFAIARSPAEIAPYGMVEQAFSPVGPTTQAERPDLVFLYGALAAIAPGPRLAEIAPVFATRRAIDASQARRVELPVLVIGGEQDKVFPPDELAAAAAAFPQSRFAAIPDAGHSAYFERSEAFNAAVLQLCAQT